MRERRGVVVTAVLVWVAACRGGEWEVEMPVGG